MSRRCPKRNHLFLKWLKANRFRFLFKPQILTIRGHHIRGVFSGVTSAIRFQLSRGGLAVSVFWRGEFWDIIGDFDVAERHIAKGYYSAFLLPEWITYYPTREELWIRESFEPFLTWCNEKLAASRWLAIYEYGDGGCTEAKLQNVDNAIANPALRSLIQNLEKLHPSPRTGEDFPQNLVQLIPVVKAD